jgi:hypothetical protein
VFIIGGIRGVEKPELESVRTEVNTSKGRDMKRYRV